MSILYILLTILAIIILLPLIVFGFIAWLKSRTDYEKSESKWKAFYNQNKID